MPYYVHLPGNRDVEFPDDYPREDAIRVAREMFRQSVEPIAAAPAPAEERSLLGGALSRGYNTAQSSGGSALEGLGNVLGIESLRNYGAESRRRNQQEAEQAQPAERRATFEEANTLGDYARATGQAVAESLPATGLGLAGGIAGGAIGSLLGPVGTAAGAFGGRTLGAFLGSSLASLPMFYGSNRQRQIEESTPRDEQGRPTGEGTVSSEGAAFGAAVPQAAMEGVTDVLLAGLGRFFRGGAEEVGKSLLPRIATGIGVGAASEVPAEVLQQALERAQAGMELLSPEAYREYREATIAALAAGGTMGGTISGAFGQRPAPPKPREEEDEALRQHLETLALQRAAENAPQPPAPVAPQPEAVVPNGNEVPVDNGVMPKAAVAPTAPMAQQPPALAAPETPVQAAPEAAPAQPQAPEAPPPVAPVVAPVSPIEQTPIEPAPVEVAPEPVAPEEPAPVVETPTQVLPPVPPAPVTPEQQALTDEDRFPGITELLRVDPAKVDWEITQVHGKTSGWNSLTEDEKQDVYNSLQVSDTEFAKAPRKRRPKAAAAPAVQAEPQPIIAPEPAKVAEAQRYVNEQIEAIRKTGKQGEEIAQALDAVVQDPSYHPLQAYSAFIAGNAMARVLPKGAGYRIKFTKELIKPKATEEEKARAKASGIKEGEGAAGGRSAAEQLIEISLAPQVLNQMRQTAAHEAFHVLQDYYAKFDPAFMKVADAAFTDGSTISTIDKSIRRKLENTNLPASNKISEDGKYKTYWQALEGNLGDRTLSAREQQAYTYAALYDAARFGTPMTGLKPSMTRFINFLRDFFADVRNALKGNGFNNVNDLFGKAVEQGGSRFNEDQILDVLKDVSTNIEFAAATGGGAKLKGTPPDVELYPGKIVMIWDVVEGGSIYMESFIKGNTVEVGSMFPIDYKKNPNIKKTKLPYPFNVKLEIGHSAARKTIKDLISVIIQHAPNVDTVVTQRIGGARERLKKEKQMMTFKVPKLETKPVINATPNSDREFAAAARGTGMTLPGFKEWFGDSKVVNADGSPKVMYHGRATARDFKEFGNSKSGILPGKEGPFFFSEDPGFANDYAYTNEYHEGMGITGRVYPVYISAKKIFDPMDGDDLEALTNYVSKRFRDESLLHSEINYFTDAKYHDLYEDKDAQLDRLLLKIFKSINDDRDNWIGLEKKLIQNFIRSSGYDGFYLGENGVKNLAVYDPKQIKSIFNKFAPGVENEKQFAAAANGATGGLPPIGQRVPPVTQAMANGTELQIEYNVVAKALSKRFGQLGWKVEPAKVERFFTVFQDHMLPVARMVDDIKAAGGNVLQAMNTYVQQDLLSGKTADMLKQRNEGLYQKLINGIANSKVGMIDFENYLYARHATERNNYMATINPKFPDGGSGMSNATAAKVLREFNQAGKIPELEKLAVMFDAIIADTNKLRVEFGLTPDFSKMTVDSEGKLLPNWKNYAPLKGFADESVDADESINDFRPKSSRMLGAKGREDMQATGRKRMAGDIVAHAMMQNTQAVVRSQKNAVGQSFVAMIRANEKQTKDMAEILGRPLTRTAIVNGVVKVVPDIMYKGRPDILVVKDGGKEIVVQIKDKAIARAMIGATSNAPTTNNILIRNMIALNSILAKVNTAYNPEFMITNFFRDLETFGVNVEQFDVKGLRSDSIRDVKAAMAGIHDVLRNKGGKNTEMGRYFNRLKELGGTNEAYGFTDLDTRIKEINETMAKTGTTAKSWKDMAKVVTPVINTIEDYNTMVENGIRVSVFKNMVERGINEQQAAYIAKNVTVNFTKGGENRVLMNAMYLFYNASLQGTMAMVNAMGRSKKVRRIVAGIMVAGLMQDALNSMLSGEDEDGEKIYDKIPDHILKRSFIMMDPFGFTERGYISFPMPYGFNAFFNMGREMSKVARGASSPMDGAGNILGTFADAFNPVGGTNSFYNFVAPTIADPFFDIARNRDFADRPIVPERGGFGVQTPDSQKYWNNTFAPFVTASEFLNTLTGGTSVIPGAVDISPNMIQYVFNFATGAAGKFVERSFNAATTSIPAMLTGDFSEVEVRELPVVRSLAGNITSRNDMERYMERTQEVLQVRQEIRAANEAGDSARVAAAFERYPGQIEIMDSINKLTRDRSKLTREINAISRNENIPEDVRRDLVKQLRDQQNQLVGMANRLYNQRVTNRD